MVKMMVKTLKWAEQLRSSNKPNLMHLSSMTSRDMTSTISLILYSSPRWRATCSQVAAKLEA